MALSERNLKATLADTHQRPLIRMLCYALARIDKPALIIVAAKGPCGDVCDDMHKRIPGSRLEIMDNVGHALFVDDPERFNTLLENFIRGLVH